MTVTAKPRHLFSLTLSSQVKCCVCLFICSVGSLVLSFESTAHLSELQGKHGGQEESSQEVTLLAWDHILCSGTAHTMFCSGYNKEEGHQKQQHEYSTIVSVDMWNAQEMLREEDDDGRKSKFNELHLSQLVMMTSVSPTPRESRKISFPLDSHFTMTLFVCLPMDFNC